MAHRWPSIVTSALVGWTKITNEGTWDRVIRVLVALALGYGAWMTWPGPISIVSLVIGAIALVTGPAGWCPAYAIFRISTRKKVAV